MSNVFKGHVTYRFDSNRRDGGSNEKPLFNISRHPILFSLEENKQYYLALHKVIIPKSYYEIDSNYNTFIVDEEGGSSVSVTIENGNYTIDELISEIESELDSNTTNSNDYTLSYDAIRNKITISFTGTSTDITINSIADGSTINQVLGLGIPDTDNVTGDDNSINILAAASYEGLFAVNEVTKPYLEILSNISTDNYYDNTNILNMGCVVPVDDERNGLIVYDNANDEGGKINKHTINRVELQLIDPYGNQIDLNGAPWSVDFKILELTKKN